MTRLLPLSRSRKLLSLFFFTPSTSLLSNFKPFPESNLSSFSCPSCYSTYFESKPTSFSSSLTFRSLITSSTSSSSSSSSLSSSDEFDENEYAPLSGDGGGVVLQGVPWGKTALSIADEVLQQFGDDVKLYAFKTSPRGYIYVRLDKLSAEYGCPSVEELEGYSREYKKRLDEMGAKGDIPEDLALEVSSPGAERILRVPEDLLRFKEMPMKVCYAEKETPKCLEKNGIFLLESIEKESETCVWKLADVKENRDLVGKGRRLGRKQKDWRLNLPFAMCKRVMLYLDL
ncbi:hypothetical protein RJ641_012397 [Dillenia turbinata]|uniref:DUF7912 domain-containing protein n=1 Tax=Dillenia turbinata TaxID=194707 RepID=A0AAN8UU49_9MAGN